MGTDMEASSNGKSSRESHVGSTVTVGAVFRGRLYALENQVQAAQAAYGRLREKYLADEKKALAEVQHQRQRYAAEAQAAAQAMGLPVGPRAEQQWDFSPDEMTFTRSR